MEIQKKNKQTNILDNFILFLKINESHFLINQRFSYAVQKNLMVTGEFLENPIILQKSVATMGFFLFQKHILLYIFLQVFLVMTS